MILKVKKKMYKFPGVDVEEHYEINGHVNGEAPLNGKLNGQRVNGEATSELPK